MGILLVAAPWIFGFNTENPEALILYVLGGAMLVYSLLRKYELGAVMLIPMPTHLAIDVVSGILLAVSPWLFGFADKVFLPPLILGLLEIMAALMTKTVTGLK